MSNSTYRVLVVDDEKLVANNVAKYVARADPDFEVVDIASDGELALERAQQLLPHIVITDVKMPIMDGLELMRRLSDILPQTKVIIISGYNDFDLVRTALQQNAFDYLLKPINLDELRSTLGKLKTMLQAQQQMLVPTSDPQQIADSMRQFIQENYQQEINVSDMAAKMGYSTSYLTRVFKEHNNGQPPMRYLQELRMASAKQLLIDTELSVKEISPLVGYPDPFHFSRTFKQACGVSPQQYRQDAKK